MFRPAILTTLAISILGGANWAEAWNWWRGEDAFNSEQYAKSAESFAEGLTGEKSAAQSKLAYNEGTARYAAKEWATAEQAFAKAADADPKNWRANYNMGNAQVEQGYVDGTVTDKEKLKSAIKSYEEALKVAPDDADTKHNLEYVKKLLEEQEKKEQQQKNDDENKTDEEKKQDQEKKDQEKEGEQDKNKESDEQGENEKKDSESKDGDKPDLDDQKSGDKEEDKKSGDQEKDEQEQSQQQKQQQQNGGGQQQQQQKPRPDLQYSQEILDSLAEMEANIQYNRALARDQANGDPLQNLLDQLMDPSGATLGSGTERRRASSDGVDW